MKGKKVRVAILSTRDRRYHPNRRLMESAQAMGHESFLLHPRSVVPRIGTGQAMEKAFDVLVPRIGSTMEDHELAALFHLEQQGIPCLNSFRALVVARDKFLSLRKLESHKIPVPRSVMIQDPAQIPDAVEALGGFPLVAKGLRGRQGTAVERIQDQDFARYVALHPPYPIQAVLLQEFLPQASLGDVRVVVVEGKVVACMRRVPRKGEFRSNVHLRGRGIVWEPPLNWLEMAVMAARVLELSVAGVDMLEGPRGPLVLEVNTTPGFRELERVTGVDVASEIIKAAVKRASQNSSWA
ncbi:MAG: RimK family alpha-L-glutamate ligase [bacterium]